jgi:hypothetical protein
VHSVIETYVERPFLKRIEEKYYWNQMDLVIMERVVPIQWQSLPHCHLYYIFEINYAAIFVFVVRKASVCQMFARYPSSKCQSGKQP